MNLNNHKNVFLFYDLLSRKFPYLAGVMNKQFNEFGKVWLDDFEKELQAFFCGDEQRIHSAVIGYGKFSLDSMKLQVKFQKTGEYENKTYKDAESEVYQNKDYMFGLYLPGILLSHYLWRHHYAQHIFFREKFLPLVLSSSGKKFYDIGVGTGFYSKEMLIRTNLHGKGFDMSPHSLSHTMSLLNAHALNERYEYELRDIVSNPTLDKADFLVNIEVLEHLEQPQLFLNAMSKMLNSGGYGLISAAINAPNADHIYLYSHPDQVASQLKIAGFEIVDLTVDLAYQPRTTAELVPTNVAFIVKK